MNNYKVQYWIYAILNKQFGKEVKFHRDSLHKIYQVNRHGFEIATNTMDVNSVNRWLIEKLLESGYQKDEQDPNFYKKEIGNRNFYIHIKQQRNGTDYRFAGKPVIIVSIYSYKK
jgi:hypothetical protein